MQAEALWCRAEIPAIRREDASLGKRVIWAPPVKEGRANNHSRASWPGVWASAWPGDRRASVCGHAGRRPNRATDTAAGAILIAGRRSLKLDLCEKCSHDTRSPCGQPDIVLRLLAPIAMRVQRGNTKCHFEELRLPLPLRSPSRRQHCHPDCRPTATLFAALLGPDEIAPHMYCHTIVTHLAQTREPIQRSNAFPFTNLCRWPQFLAALDRLAGRVSGGREDIIHELKPKIPA